jgi:hypothetical protein
MLVNREAMRNGQNNNKRMRGRNNNHNNNHNHHHRKNQNPLTRVYESNGPDVKIRGTASHVAEKYMQLARDATTSGDPVTAENFHQHAEHYLRLIAAAQEQFRQQNPYYRPEGGEVQTDNRDDNFDDGDDSVDQPAQGQPMQGQPNFGNQAPYPPRDSQPPYPPRDSQPYGGRDQQPHHQQHQQHRPQHQQHHHQQHQPQHQQPQPQQNQQPQIQPAAADGIDGERLPSFITGGGQPPQNNGQNVGYDNQGGDRYQMHRRRRRHRGHQRPDLQGGGQGVSGNDSPDDSRSGND